MTVRKLSRHTLPIRTFYITNVALLFGLASVLGDIYSSSRIIPVTEKDCTAELRLFSNNTINKEVNYTYTGKESNYAPYALKNGELEPDSNPDAPLAPHECNITVTTVEGTADHVKRYAVVNISWSTPSNVAGLEGYVAVARAKALDRQSRTDFYNLRMTRAFVPNMNTSRFAPNTKDYYDCLRIPNLTDDSVVRFSSLPHSYNNFVEAYIHYIDTGVSNSGFQSVPRWSTLMVVQCHPQEAMVRVRFTAAPSKLRFNQYTICHNFPRISNATIKAHREEEQLERDFPNIERGVYQVWLLARRDRDEIPQCDTARSLVNRVAAIVNNIDMTRSTFKAPTTVGNVSTDKKAVSPSVSVDSMEGIGTFKAPTTVDIVSTDKKAVSPSVNVDSMEGKGVGIYKPEDNDGATWKYMTGAVIVGLVALVLTAMLTVVRKKLFCVVISSPSTASSVVSATSTKSESSSEEPIVEVISRHAKSIGMNDPGYMHDDDDESGCPNFIAPDSMQDDMSSIDSLTFDYITRQFNEDAESS